MILELGFRKMVSVGLHRVDQKCILKFETRDLHLIYLICYLTLKIFVLVSSMSDIKLWLPCNTEFYFILFFLPWIWQEIVFMTLSVSKCFLVAPTAIWRCYVLTWKLINVTFWFLLCTRLYLDKYDFWNLFYGSQVLHFDVCCKRQGPNL